MSGEESTWIQIWTLWKPYIVLGFALLGFGGWGVGLGFGA